MSTPPPTSSIEYPSLDRSKLSGTPPFPKTSDQTIAPQIASYDIAPPPALTPTPFAARLYAMLEPLAQLDADAGWSLLIFCNAIATMFDEAEEWARDSPDGPGFSHLMDLTRVDDDELPWLAQFAGVRIPAGMTDAEERAWVQSTTGFWRGTLNALIGACANTLTGTQTVLFRERDGDPVANPIEYAYELTVVTYTSETPNPAATHAALLAQKPAGIVLTYETASGSSYTALRLAHSSYSNVTTTNTNYAALLA